MEAQKPNTPQKPVAAKSKKNSRRTQSSWYQKMRF